MAVYWPEEPPRIYWDEDYARSTRWGGIVAPVDFNPFAWSMSSAGRRATRRREIDARDLERPRRVNGGCRMRFGVRMRPGDRIRRRSCLEGWTVKEGRAGDLLLVEFAHEWRNDRDESVRDATFTLIYS
jgi:hydroxyacyl-ACP dehydratase HTD2-like protein with hotdog domain